MKANKPKHDTSLLIIAVVLGAVTAIFTMIDAVFFSWKLNMVTSILGLLILLSLSIRASRNRDRAPIRVGLWAATVAWGAFLFAQIVLLGLFT